MDSVFVSLVAACARCMETTLNHKEKINPNTPRVPTASEGINQMTPARKHEIMKSSRTTQAFVVWVTVTERGLFFCCCSQPCGVPSTPPHHYPSTPPQTLPPLSQVRQIQRRNQLKTAEAATLPCGCCSCQEWINERVPCFDFWLCGRWNTDDDTKNYRTTTASDAIIAGGTNDGNFTTSMTQSQQQTGSLLHLDARRPRGSAATPPPAPRGPGSRSKRHPTPTRQPPPLPPTHTPCLD